MTAPIPGPPVHQQQPPKFLTVAEVAGALRISKMTAYRLTTSGELRAFRIGRSLRVTQADLNRYLRNAEVRGTW